VKSLGSSGDDGGEGALLPTRSGCLLGRAA
jgi:hypothetical protein